MVLNHIEYLLNSLERHNTPVVRKKRHTYLTYHGFEESSTYILKNGVVKNSIILQDGREFNISYIAKPDVVSLLRDEVSKYTDQPFNVRVESELAEFYKINRVDFWQLVNGDDILQTYVKEYYRNKLSQNIVHLQRFMMNGKIGSICAFLYELTQLFGKRLPNHQGTLIDFLITNDDIAGFCGINSQSSVNRILSTLREDGIIDLQNHHIVIKNMDYLLDNIAI